MALHPTGNIVSSYNLETVEVGVSTTWYELTVPWCSGHLRWQVGVSNAPYLHVAPDFIFGDDDFMPLLDESTTALQAKLRNWTGNVPDQLDSLISAVLDAFRENQKTRILACNKERLNFELSTLPNVDHTEFLLEVDMDGDAVEACLGIPLFGVNLTQAQAIVDQSNWQPQPSSGQQRPSLKLLVNFDLSEDNLDNPELDLQVPDWLRTLTAATSNLSSGTNLPTSLLPGWKKEQCLAEYCSQTERRLQAIIDANCHQLAASLNLLEQLNNVMGPALEINTLESSGSFALALDTALLVLHVDISSKFPEEKPLLTLQSLRHMGMAEGTKVFKDYPWSPRWSCTEMAVRIYNYLRDEIPSFMRRVGVALTANANLGQ